MRASLDKPAAIEKVYVLWLEGSNKVAVCKVLKLNLHEGDFRWGSICRQTRLWSPCSLVGNFPSTLARVRHYRNNDHVFLILYLHLVHMTAVVADTKLSNCNVSTCIWCPDFPWFSPATTSSLSTDADNLGHLITRTSSSKRLRTWQWPIIFPRIPSSRNPGHTLIAYWDKSQILEWIRRVKYVMPIVLVVYFFHVFYDILTSFKILHIHMRLLLHFAFVETLWQYYVLFSRRMSTRFLEKFNN